MLDIKRIVEEKETVVADLKKRNFNDLHIIDEVIALHEERRHLVSEAENKRAEQNKKSKEMPVVMKNSTDEEKKAFREALKELSEEVKGFSPKIKEVEEKLQTRLLYIPNLLHETTPEGKDETENKQIRSWGEKRSFAFAPKEHDEIAKKDIEFERGTKLSGARFVAYSRSMAKLQRALMNFMLDTAYNNGYEEVVPPVLVSRETMTGSGQLPKFEDDAFKTLDDYFLIPTAEVSLINFHRDEILNEDELTKAYVAYTPCFRREAGSYGKDTRGIIRLHQFNKVELIKFTRPEHSDEELEKLLTNAEEILQKLGLHYNVVQLCSGDMGFAAQKTYDIEVWLPGQNAYREISSCSNTGDFQARRASIRFKRKDAKKPEFVHTINGSGLAIDRAMVAVLENYQEADGSVVVPEVLRPYMNGIEVIRP